MNNFKRIAINTGGDAPGLNAVIQAAVHAKFRLIIHGSGGPSLTR
jgi:6-phosphofructokinase